MQGNESLPLVHVNAIMSVYRNVHWWVDRYDMIWTNLLCCHYYCYSQGYGFVNFVKFEDAQQAIVNLHGCQLGDKLLQVSFKTPSSKNKWTLPSSSCCCTQHSTSSQHFKLSPSLSICDEDRDEADMNPTLQVSLNAQLLPCDQRVCHIRHYKPAPTSNHTSIYSTQTPIHTSRPSSSLSRLLY